MLNEAVSVYGTLKALLIASHGKQRPESAHLSTTASNVGNTQITPHFDHLDCRSHRLRALVEIARATYPINVSVLSIKLNAPRVSLTKTVNLLEAHGMITSNRMTSQRLLRLNPKYALFKELRNFLMEIAN
jgi:hypothetical protein